MNLSYLHRSKDYRFWKKVIEDKNGCWSWCGSYRQRQTGAFTPRSVTYSGVKMSPRQKAYLLFYGKPATHYIKMKCGNKDCINPKHMVLTTRLMPARDIDINDYNRLVTYTRGSNR